VVSLLYLGGPALTPHRGFESLVSGLCLQCEQIDALTSDGSSINDWAKMSSKYSYETPYGKGQFHYYQNLKTGEINAFDAKFKLTDGKVIPVDTSLNFLK